MDSRATYQSASLMRIARSGNSKLLESSSTNLENIGKARAAATCDRNFAMAETQELSPFTLSKTHSGSNMKASKPADPTHAKNIIPTVRME